MASAIVVVDEVNESTRRIGMFAPVGLSPDFGQQFSVCHPSPPLLTSAMATSSSRLLGTGRQTGSRMRVAPRRSGTSSALRSAAHRSLRRWCAAHPLRPLPSRPRRPAWRRLRSRRISTMARGTRTREGMTRSSPSRVSVRICRSLASHSPGVTQIGSSFGLSGSCPRVGQCGEQVDASGAPQWGQWSSMGGARQEHLLGSLAPHSGQSNGPLPASESQRTPRQNRQMRPPIVYRHPYPLRSSRRPQGSQKTTATSLRMTLALQRLAQRLDQVEQVRMVSDQHLTQLAARLNVWRVADHTLRPVPHGFWSLYAVPMLNFIHLTQLHFTSPRRFP